MMEYAFKPAHVLLEELGIEEPADIKIEAIAKYCQARVVYEPLHGSEARLIGFNDEAIITINETSPRERQRFSVAHELGHWMRDRGKIAFECASAQFWKEWSDENPEKRANRYAADLLLPRTIFKEQARNLPIIFESVRSLANTFETSLTATAIRLVELGTFPSMVICSERKMRVWFVRGTNVPDIVWPLQKIQPGTVAYALHEGKTGSAKPEDVNASLWIDDGEAGNFEVREHSIKVSSTAVLTLLWWKWEKQILDFMRKAERWDHSRRT